MIPCPECRTENPDDDTACFSCGKPLRGQVTIRQGSVLGGRYEVLGPLGSGGMGVVFKARDRTLDEVVALKILRADVAREVDIARRFRSEIKLARKVTHRNVCRIHEYNEEGTLRYISMEFIDGVDLKKVLRQTGGLLPAEAFEVAIQVTCGLEAIHEAGIVHRDLKTPNLMRDHRGVVRLMDFGIAKQLGGETLGATAAGLVVGTPEYMSPEQARGERVDLRSDIYALGIVLFEIFTGRLPFRGDTPLSIILKQLHDPPPLDGPSAAPIPAALLPLLRRCLAKEPGERPGSAREVVDALEAARALTFPGFGPTPTAGVTPAGEVLPPRSATPLPTPAPRGARVPLAATLVPPPTQVPAGPDGTGLQPGPASPDQAPTKLVVPERRSSPDRHRRRAGAGLGAALALAGVTVALVVSRSGSPLPASPRPGTETPSTATPATPTPSRRPIATADAPRTPQPAPVRSPILATSPASVPEVPRPTPQPSPVPAAVTPVPSPTGTPSVAPAAGGFLQLVVLPWADVVIDDRPAGRVSSGKLPVAPGPHAVRLVHPDYQPLQRKITVLPGETVSLVVDLREDAVPKKR